ncbi:MAG: hypothetical protein ACSHX8_07950 [Opitutaceae bacterium]
MPSLTLLEKTELCLIAIAIAALSFLHTYLPLQYSTGGLIASLALTLLLHGFIRDIYLLYKLRRAPETEPKISMRCMCLESSIGLPAVILGAILSILAPDWKLQIPTELSAVMYSIALIFGFLIKDLVITWRPLGLRREKNHSRIQFKL